MIQIIRVFYYVKRAFYCILFTDPPYLASQAVELMFAKKSAGGAFACVAKQATVGAEGTVVVTSG